MNDTIFNKTSVELKQLFSLMTEESLEFVVAYFSWILWYLLLISIPHESAKNGNPRKYASQTLTIPQHVNSQSD